MWGEDALGAGRRGAWRLHVGRRGDGDSSEGRPPVPSRAAQKLSLAAKRRKPHPPPAPAARGTSAYPTDFSGVLQLWPPPAPPCLLRAGAKAKDNPSGVGKVGPAPPWPLLPSPGPRVGWGADWETEARAHLVGSRWWRGARGRWWGPGKRVSGPRD